VNIDAKKQVPPPGHYGRGIEINKKGNYPLSTIPNSRAAVWSPHKGNRFQSRRQSDTPGPGVYNPSDYSQGLYLLSTFKNHGTPQMIRPPPIQKMKTIPKDDTPGPGSYMPPSDFGYLEMYKYSPRTSQGMRSTMQD
jgi:hypothetical protein